MEGILIKNEPRKDIVDGNNVTDKTTVWSSTAAADNTMSAIDTQVDTPSESDLALPAATCDYAPVTPVMSPDTTSLAFTPRQEGNPSATIAATSVPRTPTPPIGIATCQSTAHVHSCYTPNSQANSSIPDNANKCPLLTYSTKIEDQEDVMKKPAVINEVTTTNTSTTSNMMGMSTGPNKQTETCKRPRQTKRQRVCYSDLQLAALEGVFRINPYPSKDQREQLCLSTALAPDKVKTWFQNRRSREKRHQKAIAAATAKIAASGNVELNISKSTKPNQIASSTQAHNATTWASNVPVGNNVPYRAPYYLPVACQGLGLGHYMTAPTGEITPGVVAYPPAQLNWWSSPMPANARSEQTSTHISAGPKLASLAEPPVAARNVKTAEYEIPADTFRCEHPPETRKQAPQQSSTTPLQEQLYAYGQFPVYNPSAAYTCWPGYNAGGSYNIHSPYSQSLVTGNEVYGFKPSQGRWPTGWGLYPQTNQLQNLNSRNADVNTTWTQSAVVSTPTPHAYKTPPNSNYHISNAAGMSNMNMTNINQKIEEFSGLAANTSRMLKADNLSGRENFDKPFSNSVYEHHQQERISPVSYNWEGEVPCLERMSPPKNMMSSSPYLFHSRTPTKYAGSADTSRNSSPLHTPFFTTPNSSYPSSPEHLQESQIRQSAEEQAVPPLQQQQNYTAKKHIDLDDVRQDFAHTTKLAHQEIGALQRE